MVSLGCAAGALIIWVFLSPKETNVDKVKAQHAREAQIQLRRICDLQQIRQEEKGGYAASIEDLDYYQGMHEGAKFRYEIEAADSNDFTAVAIGLADVDKDGTYALWRISRDCKPVQSRED